MNKNKDSCNKLSYEQQQEFDEYMKYILDTKKMEIIKEIFNTREYIEWLNEFIDKYPKFNNSEYCENIYKDFTDTDKIQISKLEYLYEGIEKYVISTNKLKNNRKYYNIKFNNVGIKVKKTIQPQKVIFNCDKVNLNNRNEFISYDDIEIWYKKIIKKNKLQCLSNYIKNLFDYGIPVEDIIKTSEEAIQKIYKMTLNGK